MKAPSRAVLVAGVCAAATVVVFFPSISHGILSWDDDLLVFQNPNVWRLSWSGLRWAFTSALAGPYQPLVNLAWSALFSASSGDPRAFHLLPIICHAITCGLFYSSSRTILAMTRPESGLLRLGALDAGAAWAALFFSLHPLRVESVSWISELRDPMCGVFWMASLQAYLRTIVPGRTRASLVPAAVFFTAACLMKATAVTLPAVLVILDRSVFKRPIRPSIREKLPMFALATALGFAAFAFQASSRSAWSLKNHTLAARCAQAGYALVFYVWKTVCPTGLSPFYELRAPLNPMESRFLLAAACIAAAIVWCWRRRHAQPWVGAALLSYVLILLPVSGLMQAGSQLVADRYSYLAGLPLALLAGGYARATLERTNPKIWAVFWALILGVMAKTTVAQQGYWKDSTALWSRALQLDGNSATAWMKYGEAAVQSRLYNVARDAFERVLTADPICLELRDRLEKGEELDSDMRSKFEIRPLCRKGLTNLGAANGALGVWSEAGRYLNLAVKVDPSDGAARKNLELLAQAQKNSGRRAAIRGKRL